MAVDVASRSENTFGSGGTSTVQVCFEDEERLYSEFSRLSKWQLCLLSSVSNRVRKEKYNRQGRRLYGNLPRGFSVEQLKCFFENVEGKYKIFFLVQFFFGLRVGEVQRIEYVEAQNLVRVENKKCGRVEYLPVFEGLKKVLLRLDEVQGFDVKSARFAFRRDVRRAGLYYEYGKSSNGKRLGQFSTHSLRHTAINLFAGFVRDPFKWCQFSRHDTSKLLGVSAVYRHYGLDEMRVDMEKVFKPILKEII